MFDPVECCPLCERASKLRMTLPAPDFRFKEVQFFECLACGFVFDVEKRWIEGDAA